jgi:hypothetical protein
LAATVNSVQANIGSSVDAALADGLADINAAVAELEGQIDNIATGEDVDDINSTLEGLETDLQDLLNSNNVYSNPVIIYNVATLDLCRFLYGRRNAIGKINRNASPPKEGRLKLIWQGYDLKIKSRSQVKITAWCRFIKPSSKCV